MAKQRHTLSPALDAYNEFLAAFRFDEQGYFPCDAPSILTDAERVSVSGLLSLAKQLEYENAELKQMLKDAQSGVDRSISYLDSDQ